MASYKTNQQSCLLKFLKAHPREPMSVHEMYRRMGQEHPVQSIPGESTIYRLLRKFTEEGLVRKSVDTQSRESFYVYASPPEQGAELYMRCRVCGKLHPMQLESCEHFLRQIREQENFTIDANLVLDGVCQQCQ